MTPPNMDCNFLLPAEVLYQEKAVFKFSKHKNPRGVLKPCRFLGPTLGQAGFGPGPLWFPPREDRHTPPDSDRAGFWISLWETLGIQKLIFISNGDS